MKPSVLIFYLGVICGTVSSCQPIPPQAPTPFGAVVRIPTCQMDATTFVQQKVFFLSPTFDPQATSPYKAPSGSSVYNVQPYSNDMIAAYNAAPPYFQQELCGLDGVFIVQNSCSTTPCTGDVINNSWGFREHFPQIPKGQTAKRYIATSQQLWQGGQTPLLSDYETQRLRYLLHWPSLYVSPLYPPIFSNVVSDNRTMSLLAALAHEFGHVYWWDIFVQTPGDDISPSAENACPTAFYASSWQNGPAIPPGRWINFGDASDNFHEPDDVNMAIFFQELFNGNQYYRAVGDLLHAIYSGDLPKGKSSANGRWASALAAYSTDEDLVETFQLEVLMNAQQTPLTSLPLTIYRERKNPVTDDIPANLGSKPVLITKMACLGHLPPLH
jgi:hypothetical protein